MNMKYQFAVKKEVLNSGKELFTPCVRTVKKVFFRNVYSNWDRVTKIYDRFTTLELDFYPELTFEECKDHLTEYKKVLQKNIENNLKEETYLDLEE